MPLLEAIPLNWLNALAVINTFVDKQLNVVVAYPISADKYAMLQVALKNLPVATYFVTLSPALKVALSARGDRILNEWELERIKYHYKIGIHQPNFGLVIDNSTQTADETGEAILKYIQSFSIADRH
jgi:hypothetical protein